MKLFLLFIQLTLVASGHASQLLAPSDAISAMAAFKMVYEEDVGRRGCSALFEPGWFIADPRFGSSTIAAQTTNYTLTQTPEGEELLRIFKLASTSPETFRRKLDAWLFARSQMRAISLQELKNFLAQNSSLDFPVFDSAEDEAKGYISHKAFTFALGRGLLPMGDPHDLFFHIPAFLDPHFGDSLQRIARLIFETADRPEHRLLFAYLIGELRTVGVENWSYLVTDSENKPQLFLQGGKPFFAINRLASTFQEKKNLISSFVNVQSRETSVDDFTAFPKWQQFARKETPAAILKKLSPLLNAIEIPRRTAKRAERQLQTQLGDSREIVDFFKMLAEFINRDPVLKRAFSAETRGEASRLILDLLENYWRWIQANLK